MELNYKVASRFLIGIKDKKKLTTAATSHDGDPGTISGTAISSPVAPLRAIRRIERLPLTWHEPTAFLLIINSRYCTADQG